MFSCEKIVRQYYFLRNNHASYHNEKSSKAEELKILSPNRL